MARQYDATTKYLLEAHPLDWIQLAGLPSGKISVVDADVSTISLAADKVFRVDGADPYIAHFELQSGPDSRLDRRTLTYNVSLGWRHQLPVRSVVVLLRPAAMVPEVIGRVAQRHARGHRLLFQYSLIRAWELPVELLLSSGLGVIPLAPIGAVRESELPSVIDRMRQRIERDAPPDEARELWLAADILMGLRFRAEVVQSLMRGIINMEESTTYQAIVQKGMDRGIERGEAQGRVKESRALLVRLASRRFGPPNQRSMERIDLIESTSVLEGLVERVLDATDWNHLLSELQ